MRIPIVRVRQKLGLLQSCASHEAAVYGTKRDDQGCEHADDDVHQVGQQTQFRCKSSHVPGVVEVCNPHHPVNRYAGNRQNIPTSNEWRKKTSFMNQDSVIL